MRFQVPLAGLIGCTELKIHNIYIYIYLLLPSWASQCSMIDAISFLLIIDLSDPNVSLFSTQFSPQLRSKKSIVKIRYSIISLFISKKYLLYGLLLVYWLLLLLINSVNLAESSLRGRGSELVLKSGSLSRFSCAWKPLPLPFQTPTTQPSPFRGDLLKAEQLRPRPHEDDCKRKR